MNWKKIFNAAKLPFAILFAYWILVALLAFAHFGMGGLATDISAAITCLIVFWAGFRGAKMFGLDYAHAAIAGAILSLVPMAFGFVTVGYAVIAFAPSLIGELIAEVVVEGAKLAILSAVVALAGAFAADKLAAKKKSRKVKK